MCSTNLLAFEMSLSRKTSQNTVSKDFVLNMVECLVHFDKSNRNNKDNDFKNMSVKKGEEISTESGVHTVNSP